MRAAITGASGFIGRHLCRLLRAQRWEVICVGRVHRTAEIIDQFQRRTPDVVFHLASLFVSEHNVCDIEQLVASNLLFGTQLLEAMKQTKVMRLVTAGTSWQCPHPANLYASTKQAFETIVAHYAGGGGMKAVTLLLPDTYGPEDSRPKLINALRNAMVTGERLKMLPGDHLIDLVHVDDVCRAFLAAADLSAGRWSVSAGAVTLEMVVNEFLRASGKTLSTISIGWGERRYRPGQPKAPWIGPILPGWTPRVSLREGMEKLFA